MEPNNQQKQNEPRNNGLGQNDQDSFPGRDPRRAVDPDARGSDISGDDKSDPSYETERKEKETKLGRDRDSSGLRKSGSSAELDDDSDETAMGGQSQEQSSRHQGKDRRTA